MTDRSIFSCRSNMSALPRRPYFGGDPFLNGFGPAGQPRILMIAAPLFRPLNLSSFIIPRFIPMSIRRHGAHCLFFVLFPAGGRARGRPEARKDLGCPAAVPGENPGAAASCLLTIWWDYGIFFTAIGNQRVSATEMGERPT